MSEPISLKSMPPDQMAKLLSKAMQQKITEEEVNQIANQGDLLGQDGKIDFLQMLAFLVDQ